MAIDISKRLKLHETTVLFNEDAFSGSKVQQFQLTNGEVCLFSLIVTAIDPTAQVFLRVKNGFAVDADTDLVLQLQALETGFYTKVVNNIHNIFDVEVEVLGGNASIHVGITILMNGIKVNSDGSINANIIDFDTEPPQKVINLYDEALSVANGVEETILSYLVPTGVEARLQRIEFSGENIAHYRVYINGEVQSSRRTHHGSGRTGEFNYVGGSEEGLRLLANQLVELKVIHIRPVSADFEGRLQAVEIGTSIVNNVLLEDGDSMVQENGFQLIL